MFASVESMETRSHDEALRRFVDARDLPPELQRETLEQLFRSASGELRQRALRAGAILLPDEALVEYLREGADDVLRNAGLEMLKLRGRRAFGTAVSLLGDADNDVVLQAVLVLDHLRDPRAWSHMRRLLQHEDANVVQATITAAGHLAGTNGSHDLIPFLSADPWLQIAAVQALGDLRSTCAVPHLAALLGDPFLQSFVAEALTRIGEISAYRILADHWLSAREEVDAGSYLQLLAAMLTQFEQPPEDEKLRDAAARCLGSGDRATAVAAAWCILSLDGAGGDGKVLDVIAATTDESHCPPCIATRSELVTTLVRRDPPLRNWGYEILSRLPDALPAEVVAGLIVECPPTRLDSLGIYLASSGDSVLAAPLLALWIERRDEREALAAAARRHSRALTELLPTSDIGAPDRVALLDAIGAPPTEILAALSRLDESGRWAAVADVHSCAVMKALPWVEWMATGDREQAGRALAEAAAATGCRELLPILRSELAARPQREIVRAVGDLRDPDSVPILTALLQHTDPLFRAAIFDSLGRIGDAGARAVLRSYCVSDPRDAGQACRALAMCASEADAALLRSAADWDDLSVRLAVIAPLASFPGEENARVLRRLLFDVSAAVARRAQSAFDLSGGQSGRC